MPNSGISVGSGAKMWGLGGLTKKQLAKKAWHEIFADDVLGQSAQLAYFFLFAIFPLAIFLTSLLGVFAGPNSHLAQHLTHYLTRVMPSSAGALVRKTVHHSLASSGGGELAFGIGFALFFASSGMVAMIQSLNVVFDVDEARSLLKQRFTALWLTIAVGILICASIFLITVGGKVAGAELAGGFLYWLWQILQYPVALFFLLISFSLVYRFAPNTEGTRWRLFTPGSVTALILWAIVSFGLRVYLRHFNTYTSEYGTMGAFMVLMLWFYLTGMAFLIGGEIDAIIDRATFHRTKRPRHGQQAAGGGQSSAEHAA